MIFCLDRAVMLAWVLAGAHRHLGREQAHDETVLVGRPHGGIAPEEARPGALLAGEATRSVEQDGHEPFETDRHLVNVTP